MEESERRSESELREMLTAMRRASDTFYRQAALIGHHAFIEFAGLMHEYIVLCECSLTRGGDFTETSVHGGKTVLPMEGHHRRYLSEKLTCIYGKSLDAIVPATATPRSAAVVAAERAALEACRGAMIVTAAPEEFLAPASETALRRAIERLRLADFGFDESGALIATEEGDRERG